MKKIIFIVLSFLLLISCSEEQKKKYKDAEIVPSYEWHYKGHHYLVWNRSQWLNSIVHDPDCPCHLDTLGIYVVDNKDTTYVIKKK